ncbi:MAG: hypothetical protein WA984_09605, partial [Phormidesmis sp.]
ALGDVALIDLPNGKRYVIAVLVERPANDGRAQELIRRISGLTYEEAAKAVQPSVAPSENPEGAEGAAPSEGLSPGEISPTDTSTGTPADAPTLDEPYTEETYTEETYTEEPYPSADP